MRSPFLSLIIVVKMIIEIEEIRDEGISSRR